MIKRNVVIVLALFGIIGVLAVGFTPAAKPETETRAPVLGEKELTQSSGLSELPNERGGVNNKLQLILSSIVPARFVSAEVWLERRLTRPYSALSIWQ